MPRSRCASTVTISRYAVPFDEEDELCKELDYSFSNVPINSLDDGSGKSFQLTLTRKQSLSSTKETYNTLPGQPRVYLEPIELAEYLVEDITIPLFDQLASKIWTYSPFERIRSLSDQIVQGRTIVVTEKAKLHCCWADNQIFIKPIPLYMTSYSFWQFLLDDANDTLTPEKRNAVVSSALGFLRTYAYLIQHESDFHIARIHHLIPDHVTFDELIAFTKNFPTTPKSLLSSRYTFGELQLSDLNTTALIFTRHWYYNRHRFRAGAFFSQYFGPIAFLFAAFSLALNAMQVEAEIMSIIDNAKGGRKAALATMEWFAVQTIIWAGATGAILLIGFVTMTTADTWKSAKAMRKWKKDKRDRERDPTNGIGIA